MNDHDRMVRQRAPAFPQGHRFGGTAFTVQIYHGRQREEEVRNHRGVRVAFGIGVSRPEFAGAPNGRVDFTKT